MVYDTPAGETSLVHVITDVLENRNMDLPRTLRVTLRSYQLEGCEMPVYSLTDHYFILCNGNEGAASLFDGFYRNTFDGNTFESDYLRIDGIKDGTLNITIKEGQPIWPEKTDNTHAEDLNGVRYELVDDTWQEIEELAA